jgi:uncharacterized protein (DUF1697 family)
MAVHVAMLRGVNVGGRRRVPMAELRGLLDEAGYADVRTYVQSGNIVLGSPDAAAAVQRRLRELISARFGFDVPVIVRSRAQLARVVGADPIEGGAADPKHYVVTFLAEKPPAEAVKRLRELAVESERLATAGREIYTWHPDGQARSKMAAQLTAKGFGANATARNWTTVTTLLEMASG